MKLEWINCKCASYYSTFVNTEKHVNNYKPELPIGAHEEVCSNR